MKKSYYPRFKIDLSTFVFIFLGIYFNALSYLIIFYFLAFIHECFHLIMAKIFHVKIGQMVFHPLGFSLELKDILYEKSYKQIIIYLAGPLSYFISYLLLYFFYKSGILSYYGYLTSQENNLSLLLFNLIPFYPLDGGKIMEVILLKIFPSKKAIKIRIGITLMLSIFLLNLCIQEEQLLLFFFLLYSSLSSLFCFRKEYRMYLESRIGHVSSFKEKTTKEENIYHFFHNLLLEKNNLIDEETYILKEKMKTLLKHKT